MRVLITLATGVGGHFLNGNRGKGYGFLLILLIWPFVFFLSYGSLLVSGFEQPASAKAAAVIFALGFVATWVISAAQALNNRRSQVRAIDPLGPLRVSELAIVSVATIAFALYSLIAFVLAPQLRPGEHITLLRFSTYPLWQPSNVRTLPTTDGDFMLVGEVRQNDRTVANAPFVFLFQDGFRTREIRTDSLGRFQYRLPPGDWRFFGPLFNAHRGEVSIVFTPEIETASPTFHVRAGAVERKVSMRIGLEPHRPQ